MARMIKCTATGECGTVSEFIKIDGKYYKNQEVYEEHMKGIGLWKNIAECVSDITGLPYGCNGSLWGCFRKKLKEETVRTGITYEDVYQNLLDNKDYLTEKFHKENSYDVNFGIISGIIKIAITIPETITYAGCYKIKNLQSGELYIGESIDLFKRFQEHITNLYAGTHHCEALQNAFNETHDFSNFVFTPLTSRECKKCNRATEKERTLYLEAAYFLKYKNSKKTLYNTVNPYIALKENNIPSDKYEIDNQRILEMLMQDEENILPVKVKEKIIKDLKKD